MTLNIKHVLARNTAWNYTGFIVNLATNLVMFPYVVHRLGDAAAGVWLLLGAVTGYMGLLEIGIVPSLTQTIAESLARDERQGVNRAASSSQALLVTLAAASLLLLPLTGVLVQALNIPASLEGQALVALRIAVVGFAMRMPLATYQGILLGSQRQDRCNQLWIALGFAKFVGAATVLGLGFGLVVLVTMEMTVHLLAGVLQVRWAHQEIPGLRLTWRLVDRDGVVRLLSFGSAILAVSVCSLIIEQTDRLVIAAFLPIAAVTHYAAAWKVYMLAFALTTTMVQAVSPLAAQFRGRGDHDGLTKLFLHSTKYAVIVAWPLGLSLAFSGGFLLRVWMGESFVSSLAIVQLLIAGFIVTAHNHAGYSALMGMRRVGPTVWRYFAPQAIANLILSVWLVQRMGSIGVALGTLIPALLLEYAFLSYVLKELGLSWNAFIKVVWPVGRSALLAFSPLAMTYTHVNHRSPVLLLAAASCVVIYAAMVWRSLGADERQDVVAHLPEFVKRRARRLVLSAGPFRARSGEGL